MSDLLSTRKRDDVVPLKIDFEWNLLTAFEHFHHLAQIHGEELLK
jgi:hypothetical protein